MLEYYRLLDELEGPGYAGGDAEAGAESVSEKFVWTSHSQSTSSTIVRVAAHFSASPGRSGGGRRRSSGACRPRGPDRLEDLPGAVRLVEDDEDDGGRRCHSPILAATLRRVSRMWMIPSKKGVFMKRAVTPIRGEEPD